MVQVLEYFLVGCSPFLESYRDHKVSQGVDSDRSQDTPKHTLFPKMFKGDQKNKWNKSL